MEILVYLCTVFVLISTTKRDLAQLVAHVVRDDEVAGSSPVIPTKSRQMCRKHWGFALVVVKMVGEISVSQELKNP